MTQEERMNIVAAITKGANVSIGQFVVENNGTMTNHQAASVTDDKIRVSDEQMAHAIERCQHYFWGNSAYAVLYCLCRDVCERNLSQAGFERMVGKLPFHAPLSYNCPTGTIANAFSDNPIYKTHVSRWEAQGASQRVLLLLKQLRKELEL